MFQFVIIFHSFLYCCRTDYFSKERHVCVWCCYLIFFFFFAWFSIYFKFLNTLITAKEQLDIRYIRYNLYKENVYISITYALYYIILYQWTMFYLFFSMLWLKTFNIQWFNTIAIPYFPCLKKKWWFATMHYSHTYIEIYIIKCLLREFNTVVYYLSFDYHYK